ncbi:MAG TPA: AI-2E family transporter [Candidatus Paceibacterota bacterium]|nr:AI-2E family transporter [Candidatus Paceibacterota bacterium]
MDTKKLQLYFFIGLLLLVVALTVCLFWSFLAPLALAFMAAIIVRPVHTFLLREWGGRRTLAAFATVLFVALVILAPLGILIHQVTIESLSFYADMRDGHSGALDMLSNSVVGPLHSLFPAWNIDIKGYVDGLADSLVQNAAGIFSSASSVGLGIFIAFVGLFYMLRDGHAFRKTIVELSPLADTYDNQIIEKIERAVNSVVRGSLFTSLIKGVLAAVGFFIFGVPHAILWGMITAIVSLLPGIGAGLTIIPAAIYLFALDGTGPAIGLLIWGTVIVGLVDNFVMPLVVGRGFTVHPLLVLLSVVGGIIFFGPVGLFLGPLVIALLSALIEIYKLVILDDEGKKVTAI